MSRRSLKEHSCSSLPRFILDGDLKLCKINKVGNPLVANRSVF